MKARGILGEDIARCQLPRLRHWWHLLRGGQDCLLCLAKTPRPHPLCDACEADWLRLGHACQRCALPLPHGSLLCGGCQQDPPPFQHVETPWLYAFPVNRVILGFKEHGIWPLGALLAHLLGQHLLQAYAQGLPRPDLLLPVPLSRQRLRQRGFNQSEMLAAWLSDALQRPTLPGVIRRNGDRPPQHSLGARERRQLPADAFDLRKAESIRGRHVALVDDVLTTGTTARTLSQVLLDAGAKRVDVYCLARTPPPSG